MPSNTPDHAMLPSYTSAFGCANSDNIFSETVGITGDKSTDAILNASHIFASVVSNFALSAASSLFANYHGARCSASLFIERINAKLFSSAMWNCIPSLSFKTSGAVSTAAALRVFSKSSSTVAAGTTLWQ